MQITFFGAVRTTTGSMHLLETKGRRVLLDCGLYQGKRKEAFERNRNLPFEPSSVDACVLSHAHIDHSGNLPTLVKRGFRGPIIATPATRDLCEIMLLDSAHLQERDVEFVNKIRRRQEKNPFEPLYVFEDVQRALSHFRQVQYETTVEVVPGVKVTFHDAGHILGAAITSIEIRENGTVQRLVFTGDLGRKNMPILKDPVVVQKVDLLITESTYGARLHPNEENVKQKLAELCQKVTERGSRLVIPAFSVGRTQQLLYYFHSLYREGRMCTIPLYVDSPLSSKATKVHEDHPECYDHNMLELLRDNDNPFTMEAITYVQDVEESKRLNETRGPVIIISASGMCEGGRILHHLKHSVEDERNVILIVGYQAENTLGRRLVFRESPIKIFGEPYELRAEVHSIQALSAHADRNEMLAYFDAMGTRPHHTYVVHGDIDQSEPFAQALVEHGMGNVIVPEPAQSVEA